MLLSLVLLLSLSRGLAAADIISAVRHEVRGTEGQSVSLSCNYETISDYADLHWYKHPSDLQVPQFLLLKNGKGGSADFNLDQKRFKSQTSSSSTELTIRELTLADTALYYCALEDGLSWGTVLTFGKPIQLTVSPKESSPVSPDLFLLGRLQPAGFSPARLGPEVCLAAGFRPSGGDMVLETTVGRVTVKTSPARLSAATKTFYYPGFTNGTKDNIITISSCKLGEASSGGGEASSGQKAGEKPDKIYPEEAKQNFFLLLISGVRLIFAKAVAFNTILTIRTLIM